MTWAYRAAWGLWTAFLVTLGWAIYVGFNPPAGDAIGVFDALWATSFIGFPTVGAVIVSRFPRRPLGWILCLAPLLLLLGVLLGDLSRGGLANPSLGWAWVEWLSGILFPVGLALIVSVPLLLPDGRLPSRRWRLLAWAIALLGCSVFAEAAFRPGYLEGRKPVANPLGIEWLRGFFEAIDGLQDAALLLVLVLSTLSIPIRFRRATGAERQQLKWLALGGVAIVVAIVVALLLGIMGFSNPYVETSLSIVAILALPVSIGLAIRRNRLYEVDVLLNRTIVYLVLSAVLAGAYLGIVLLLQRVLEPLTAESDLAIAGSTLAVAGLFRPVRSSIQTFIDRRFYRSKYDAAATLGAFSSRLRDEVDIESLRTEIVAVVRQTMQPAHASLWLRNGAPE